MEASGARNVGRSPEETLEEHAHWVCVRADISATARRACLLIVGSVLLAFANSAELFSSGWPKWPSKQPDTVEATCAIDRNEIQQGTSDPLSVRIHAQDSKHHALSYVWSGNGGKISGTGPEVKVDASRLNPGVYAILGVAQDAKRNSARCTAEFRVITPRDRVSMACTAQPGTVEQGKSAAIAAQAEDALGHPLHYRWFTNGGRLNGDGPNVQLDTSGITPGTYTVTGRVEDDWGMASDCATVVKVNLPAPPPVPPVTSHV